jgi:hypothetical protein
MKFNGVYEDDENVSQKTSFTFVKVATCVTAYCRKDY